MDVKKAFVLFFAAIGGCWMGLGQQVLGLVFLAVAVKIATEI